MANQSNCIASGVEALIERLRREGVEEGQDEARRIVENAEKRAQWMLEQTDQEIQRIREELEREVQSQRAALREALKMAVRDAVLSLKETLAVRFAEDVQRAVGAELGHQVTLQRLILEVAGRVRESLDVQDTVEILLPRDAVGLEELRHHPEALHDHPLTELTGLITRNLLRDGVTFAVAEDSRPGIRLSFQDGAMRIDLTDHAVAEVLLEHLQPRFRALVEGIVY